MAHRGPPGDDARVSKRSRSRRAAPVGLVEGEAVVVTCGVLRGRTGTLVRPARVVLDPGWMVAFDRRFLGVPRLRIATWALTRQDRTVRVG